MNQKPHKSRTLKQNAAVLTRSQKRNSMLGHKSGEPKKSEFITLTKPLNKYPLLHSASRAIANVPEKRENISISKKQKQISEYLNSNKKVFADFSRILEKRKSHQIEKTLPESDSFRRKYSPGSDRFNHQLVGNVKIPRKYFSIGDNSTSLQTKTFEKETTQTFEVSKSEDFVTFDEVTKQDNTQKAERASKARAAMKHLLQLQVDTNNVNRVRVPEESYSIPHSGEFLKAVKLNQQDKVLTMLSGNRWLALVYDSSLQTGLHWAAKRDLPNLVPLLVKAGTFIDSRDMVGRTPLFLAAKNNNIQTLTALLKFKASPFVKTRAGTSIDKVATNPTIRSLLLKYKVSYYVKKFSQGSDNENTN